MVGSMVDCSVGTIIRFAEMKLRREGFVYINNIKCNNIRQVKVALMLTEFYFTNDETTEFLAENDDLIEFADSIVNRTCETRSRREANKC